MNSELHLDGCDGVVGCLCDPYPTEDDYPTEDGWTYAETLAMGGESLDEI